MSTPVSEELIFRLSEILESATEQPDRAILFNELISRLLRADHNSVFWGDRLLTIDKSAAFLDDPDFARAFATVIGNHVYDQYSGPQSVAWRLHTLCWAARQTLDLPGDLVECGTFKGDFSWMLTQCIDIPGAGKQLHLYDSFSGFSEELAREDDYSMNPNYANIANQAYREPGIFESVVRRFGPMPYVTVTKGYLPGTLKQNRPDRIAFLHMDLNSPEAERQTLDALWDLIVPGGIIILDDYGWKFFAKQKEVEDEWAASKGHAILELPTGQGMLVKKS